VTYEEFCIQYALGTLDEDYLIKLCKNICKDKRILIALSKNKSHWVRWDVAENPNTPKEILIYLSKDPWEMVRIGIARNPKTPRKVLRRLLFDKSQYVKTEAEDRLRKKNKNSS